MTRREAIKRTSILMGGALSATAIAGVMSGCQASGDPLWRPSFVTMDQAKMLDTITDIILPATDTPSATDVHVPEFIDIMLRDCYSKADQDLFIAGLVDLDKAAEVTFSKPFGKCSDEESNKLITKLDENAFSGPVLSGGEGTGNKFYRILKELTLLGYFTSEKVMTTMLDYNSVPQKYEPCKEMTSETKVYVDDNV